MTENTYGMVKRIEFVSRIIGELRPGRVLDIGCGTGVNLTQPLALLFSDVSFVGVDSDVKSIEFANRENGAPNVCYLSDKNAAQGQFDLIIASEVIEHVEEPDGFLSYLRTRLTPGGRLVLTLPNGLGFFELASLVETLFHLSGIYGVLRATKHRLRGKRVPTTADTLAVSPHINFFSFRQITSLISDNGFEIIAYIPRTLLCGFVFDQMITSRRLLAWNAREADRLPPSLVSAWMFLLAPSGQARPSRYRRGAYARLRRFLNEKRWNLR